MVVRGEEPTEVDTGDDRLCLTLKVQISKETTTEMPWEMFKPLDAVVPSVFPRC